MTLGGGIAQKQNGEFWHNILFVIKRKRFSKCQKQDNFLVVEHFVLY